MTGLIPMTAWPSTIVIVIKNCSDSKVQWATCFTGWHLKAIKKNRHGTLFWPLNGPAARNTYKMSVDMFGPPLILIGL